MRGVLCGARVVQERTRERLFEEEMEVVWEKGGSGLVFYTDASFWKEQEGGVASKQPRPSYPYTCPNVPTPSLQSVTRLTNGTWTFLVTMTQVGTGSVVCS